MEVATLEEGAGTEPQMDTHTTWVNKLFRETKNVEDESCFTHPNYYMRKDEEEKYEGVDELFCTQDDEENQPPPFGPRPRHVKGEICKSI